jgi:hypothetical protein
MTQVTREAVEAIKEHSKHWDFCPICREGLDTGLECAHCGYDMMPVVNLLQSLWERCDQYQRAVEVLFTDDSGDLDYIKWYITNKVLTIEAQAALAKPGDGT